tara:strand:+ start:733 stop:1893 length:1161 start_codon:yes stop_codon:yes gene_type:complete
MKKIPYGMHFTDKSDLKSIGTALFSSHLTNGKFVEKFTQKLKLFLNSKNVLLTSSATAALHLAFKAINIKKNHIIIMPSINFIAAYNMASLLGAKIYLTDVDPYTGQMTPKNVEDCIKKNKLKHIYCIVNMFLGGGPNNLLDFYKLKKKYKCFLIEDACHAFGSYIKNKNKKIMVGSNIYSDISIFSFHPVKAIATGEGGCITTNSKNIFYQAQKFKNHGMLRSNDHWNYDVVSNGYNYRLSDINSALGISQLKKIKILLKKRNNVATFYKKELESIKPYLTLPSYDYSLFNSYHLFVVSIDFKKLKKDKNAFFKYMLKNKIICQLHYKPIYKFSIFKNKISLKDFKDSEYYFNNALSLPIYYNLRLKDQKFIIKMIKSFISSNIK